MFNKYQSKGLIVMGFPCNQFGKQEPQSEAEIEAGVVQKYKVKFPMFAKINVNGANTHPVYKFLKACFPGDVTWNFSSKFLIDRNGVPVARFEKTSWEEIEKEVVKCLEYEVKEQEEL